MIETRTAPTFASRILRLHRTELAATPGVAEWSTTDVTRLVAERLEDSSTAEAVAVLQVVPIRTSNSKGSSGRRQAEARTRTLANHCRAMVRAYDRVGILNGSVVIIMWGVTADESLMRSVAHRIQGGEGSSAVPAVLIGASIARPGSDALEVIQASSRAVAQARWSSKPLVVYGATPMPDQSIDPRDGIEVVLSPLLDKAAPNVSKMQGRLVLCSSRRRRTDYFAHPGASMVDRLVVGIDSVAALLAQPQPGWDELHAELPLAVLRASNTTPRVVESVMAELQQPERLTLMLSGPGGPEMLSVVDDLLAPIRQCGANVERVIDYGTADPKLMQEATLLRVNATVANGFVMRSEPGTALRDGPLAVAAELGIDVALDAGRHRSLVRRAHEVGVRYVSGEAIGSPTYQPLRTRQVAA